MYLEGNLYAILEKMVRFSILRLPTSKYDEQAREQVDDSRATEKRKSQRRDGGRDTDLVVKRIVNCPKS